MKPTPERDALVLILKTLALGYAQKAQTSRKSKYEECTILFDKLVAVLKNEFNEEI